MADFGAVWDPAALGNYDASRMAVNLIVDHHTASSLAAALGRFQTAGTKVSAHFCVDHDGTVYELVPLGDTAYDTGDYPTNQRSVGIEHVSVGPNGEPDYFTDLQYEASAQLHIHIGEHFGFPIDPDHVWPHNRVVPTECPGTLDLGRLIEGGDMATGYPAGDQAFFARFDAIYNYAVDVQKRQIADETLLQAVKAELDNLKVSSDPAVAQSVARIEAALKSA